MRDGENRAGAGAIRWSALRCGVALLAVAAGASCQPAGSDGLSATTGSSTADAGSVTADAGSSIPDAGSSPADAGSASAPTITISPSAASVPIGGTQRFLATVTGGNRGTSSAVTWRVVENGCGSIDGNGLYAAPLAPASCTVEAATADGSGRARAPVTVAAPSSTDTTGIIPAERRTTWNPGIPGGVPVIATVHATLDAAAYGNGTTDATAAIDGAIQAAGDAASATNPQVVFLPAGTYRISSTLSLDRDHVVLRGAGPSQTRIVTTGPTVARLGVFPEWAPAAVDVVGSAAKGASSFTVADASHFSAGDVLVIDKVDDPALVTLGGGTWWKRGPTPDNGPVSPGGLYRSMGQTIEVASVSGNTLTIVGVLHTDFPASLAPQVFGAVNSHGVRGAGLEDLSVTGTTASNGLDMRYCARCWIKDVESDGSPVAGDASHPGMDGVHVSVTRSVRSVVRDSYIHHARSYITNRHAYGISVNTQSSDNLIENNIAFHLNKNLVLEASGGGNVIGYNYIDDPLIETSPNWQEVGMDGSHLSHPFMELFEGNYTPHMGAAVTHGSASCLTFFRNTSTTVSRTLSSVQTANREAIQLDADMKDMNVVGNVLLAPGLTAGAIYEPTPQNGGTRYAYTDWLAPTRAYWLGGWDPSGNDPQYVDPGVRATILRTGNFDYVTNSILWDASTGPHDLPLSLYLTVKPAFFGTELWPYVDPGRSPRVGNLPAKLRFEAMP